MHKQLFSKRRAESFSLTLFFIGLGIIAIIGSWWPSIMLVIGFSLALRQLLLGKFYEMAISLIIFSGVFVTQQFKVTWKVIWPVVFFTCALFILLREYVDEKTEEEDQHEEDLSHEIEEKDTDSEL